MKSIVQGESIDILLDLLETLDDENKQKLLIYARIHDARTWKAAANIALVITTIFLIIEPVELAISLSAIAMILAITFHNGTGGKNHKRFEKSNNVV